MELYLIRHGETEMNRADVFRGRADPPLNQRGLEQAGCLGEGLAGLDFEAFYASPLLRSMQTAEAAARPHRGQVLPLEGFIDVDYGEWSGLRVDEVRSRWPREFALWVGNPAEVVFPGGESLAGVFSRLKEGLLFLRTSHTGNVLVVGHKVVNRLVLCACLGLGPEGIWRLDQSNGAVNRIAASAIDGEWVVRSMNDTAHLAACMSREQDT